MNNVLTVSGFCGHSELVLETGKLAKQADGAVVVRVGNAMLLATVVTNKKVATEELDFLPLHVEYQEKYAAAGKIPGGFLKREGKLGDHEVLMSRLVDRVIRPLFPKGYALETQVNVTLISADVDVIPESLAALAVSAALVISPIPFTEPVSEVRVVKKNGVTYINPSANDAINPDLDIIVGATYSSVLMIEGEMNQVQENEILDAVKLAHDEIKKHCQLQNELVNKVNPVKWSIEAKKSQDECINLQDNTTSKIYDDICALIKKGAYSKAKRTQEMQQLKDLHAASLPENSVVALEKSFKELEKKAIRNLTIHEGIRLDGRKPDEIRKISSEIGLLPSAHGSALFTRGETQCLSTVTLGSKLNVQVIDRALENGYNAFMLHYNFPGFSTGEVKVNRGLSRREIGHGNLAMRALKQVMPSDDVNPYTVRIVSDILESNGSSSMATVCAGSLALMDSGVAIEAPVSGIAMGLFIDQETGKYTVVSDILGGEDGLGDMDFKVAGTEKGITACQMDIKTSGLSYEMLKEALAKSKTGRLHILNEMNKIISKSNSDHKPHAPKIQTIKINKDMIGAVIGTGGKVIQEIQRVSGATVSIEEDREFGIVKIFAQNSEVLERASKMIKDIVVEPEVGVVYTGRVKAIREFGAFVEFMPGREGLLHISEIKWGGRIENLSEILEKDEEVQVKLVGIDAKTGKFRLSRKALLPNPELEE